MKKIILSFCIVAGLAACDASDSQSLHRQCGAYEVEMTFSNNGDTLNAIIGGDTVALNGEISASGAKYSGILNDTGISLWGKGDDWIMILDDDTVIDCVVK